MRGRADSTGREEEILGSVSPKEVNRFVPKQPVSGALLWMTSNMVNMVDGLVAVQKAPLPEDPAAISRHIKELAYFLRADAVGICKLPPYAVYTHRFPKGDPIELNHRYAIAVLVDQDWRTANAFTGSDWISNAMSFLAYSTSGFIACIQQNISAAWATRPGLTMHGTTR